MEWQRGRCWMGRAVARGLGWMRLENLRAYRLTTAHIKEWPDNSKPLDKVIEGFNALKIESKDFSATFELQNLVGKTHWHYLEISGTIKVGERDDGYGLDGLSVGGHSALAFKAAWDDEHYLKPQGVNEVNFTPDQQIVMTCNSRGELEPFIPGAGLRGPLRHTLSRLLRGQGKDIRDPNNSEHTTTKENDVVADLFGQAVKGDIRSAALLVRDAYLKGNHWQAAWLQHHAEDEFSGGVYGSGKFDRVALVSGTFEWKMVIEAESEEAAEDYLQCLKPVFQLGQQRHLPIGGNQWRGLGWVEWTITQVCQGKVGVEPNERPLPV